MSQPNKNEMKKDNGFTLVELMIVVAVIGILAAIAYPAYTEQIRKARRAETQAALMNISTRQQQMLLDTRSYASTVALLNVALPTSVTRAYDITLTVGIAAVPTFTATATPVALSAQAADTCGVLTINQAGTKTPSNCW